MIVLLIDRVLTCDQLWMRYCVFGFVCGLERVKCCAACGCFAGCALYVVWLHVSVWFREWYGAWCLCILGVCGNDAVWMYLMSLTCSCDARFYMLVVDGWVG
jgi:hypothetical protein